MNSYYIIVNQKNDLEKLIKESIRTYNQIRPHLSLNMATPEYIYQKTSEVNATG